MEDKPVRLAAVGREGSADALGRVTQPRAVEFHITTAIEEKSIVIFPGFVPQNHLMILQV
jgi:hypothetical protein